MSLQVVVGLVFLTFAAHQVIWRKRETRTGKPPLVPYLLPWIGSMFSLAKDPDRFFQVAGKSCGGNGVFGVMVGGNTKYYVTDATLIREVYRNTKSFAFSPIRLEYSVAIFDMSPSAVYTPYMKDDLFEYHHRLLSSTAIGPLITSYSDQAIRLLSSFKPSPRTSLIKFLHPQMYDSAMLAFMGSTFPTTKTYPLFLAFDDAFPLFAAGFMPDFVTSRGKKVRSQLTDVIEQWLEEHWKLNQRDESASDLVKKMVEDSRAIGFDDREVAAMLLTDLWALQANSTWACFWVIALMLRQASGLTPLYEEISTGLKTFKGTSMSEFLSATPLPLLTSTITETLRFTTSSFSIRRVTDSEGACLASYTFQQDDELVCNTRTLHMSPDIYEEPLIFKPDRFIGDSKEKAGRFWNPFGGGVSMCEGRHFAQQEIRIFIACLLLYFDISLDPASTRSSLMMDMTRIGLGVLHPKGDLNIIVKRKEVSILNSDV